MAQKKVVAKKAPEMDALSTISMVLVIIGGLNWGLTALGYNVVNMLLGSIPMLEKVVYLLVGIAALVLLYKMATMKK